jgi:hypothetical protein
MSLDKRTDEQNDRDGFLLYLTAMFQLHGYRASNEICTHLHGAERGIFKSTNPKHEWGHSGLIFLVI